MLLLISVILFIFTPETCVSEVLPSPSSLYLYSPGSLDFTDVIVKRVGDNLTLICEMRGDTPPPAYFVWNYMAANDSLAAESPPYSLWSNGTISQLNRTSITEADSGRYFCAAPPHSQAKYVLVQPQGGRLCASTALRCGSRCVLATNVCDGRPDCLHAEDEDEELCGVRPCDRPDRLNCSMGRCIPAGACCLTPHPLCRQHSCCAAHTNRGFDLEWIPPFEDRRAPDDYGFIQSTIYTVTACALIFMIAVVLLVSAICKMHMKRAALRHYARPDTRYNINLGVQRHRFPPCYEAADLLEQAAHDPPSPLNDARCTEQLSSPSPTHSECRNTRLSALASVFSSRYRQVPTQCTEVEMVAVSPPAPPSPINNGADGVNDRHRLTLQLGRFHLSIPSFRRDPRPDTPNVAEINIDDLDFVRLNTNDTYTLNGRTIRLLNGNFENIPVLNNPPPYNEAMRYKLYGPPPEYLSSDRLNRNTSEERARSNIELPPGYEELGVNGTDAVGEASNLPGSSFYSANASSGNCSRMISGSLATNAENLSENVENTPVANVGNVSGNVGNASENVGNVGNASEDIGNASSNIENASGVVGSASTNVGNTSDNIDNPIENVINANENIGDANVRNNTTNIDNGPTYRNRVLSLTNIDNTTNSTVSNIDNASIDVSNNASCDTNNGNANFNGNSTINVTEEDGNNNETLNSVIDNLPAIDSDVNANDEVIGAYVVA
ncbi:hypothetical protein evm_003156 [Chilo suppressalis]|nr:hypothetical protein evm_003156 [Chilo suppressalis]